MRERIAYVLAFAVPLVVYAASAYRDVTYWDVGEMDTVPWILGIAHPTGFPAYVLIGWVFSHVVAIGSVALRMSLLSALAMSIAAWCIARVVGKESENPWLGAAAGWFFAFGVIVWTHATRAEVHALATAAYAVMIAQMYAWHRNGNDRMLYAAALAFGLGLAVHPVMMLAVPGILVLVVARLHETQTRTLLIALLLAIGSAGVWFTYLPLRSAYVSAHALDPNAQLGHAQGGAFWDYDHPASWDGFVALVTGAQFDLAGGVRAIASQATYERELPRYLGDAVREWTIIGVVLVLLGMVRLARRDLAWMVALTLWAAVATVFAFGYGEESDVARYELPSFVIGAIFAGSAWSGMRYAAVRIVPPLIVMVCAFALLSQNAVLFGQPHDRRAREEITEIVAVTPPNAVLVSTWVLSPALAYDAYVNHSLEQRIVDAAWIGDEVDLLPRWLRTRPVYVVGSPEGSVPGFRLERIPTHTQLYRVFPEAHSK